MNTAKQNELCHSIVLSNTLYWKRSDKIYSIGLPKNVESLKWITFWRIVITQTHNAATMHCASGDWAASMKYSTNAFGFPKCLYSACADNNSDDGKQCTLHWMNIEKQTDFQPFISIPRACCATGYMLWIRVVYISECLYNL